MLIEGVFFWVKTDCKTKGSLPLQVGGGLTIQLLQYSWIQKLLNGFFPRWLKLYFKIMAVLSKVYKQSEEKNAELDSYKFNQSDKTFQYKDEQPNDCVN